MGEVFAGFVCGYILALIGAPALAIALPGLRVSNPIVARILPAEAPIVPVVVVLHGGLIVVCTGAGLILGMLLYAMRDAAGGLGSPNFAFTLLVFGLTLAIVAPVVILFGRIRTPALIVAVFVLGLFGWLMPYMAGWSKFGSS